MKSTRYGQSQFSVSRKITFLFLIALLCLAPALPFVGKPIATAAAQSSLVFPVDPRATFLHTAMTEDPEVSDDPFNPTIIDLAQAGLAPGAEIKLSYQILQPFSYACGSNMPKYDDPLILAVFSGSAMLLPPQEEHRVPDAIKTGEEVRTGPVGLAAMSQPDDIPEDFQIMPVSGTVIRIPAGATHLFIGIVDSFYKDNCGALNITLERAQTFDVCLQDNASGDTLLFNSFTGDWRFIRCGADGFVHNDTGGRRAIQRRGNTITLNDAFVSAIVDLGYARGSATIRNPNLVGGNFQIQDSYTKDNTCACR
ncbi:MAG: hypothetical protein SF339_25725 [Blastocatellia bacterium]|nr:hypothetical protein [Blastocatellia bacterium]